MSVIYRRRTLLYISEIEEGGTLWTWGYNNNGELGQDDTTDRSSPVQVGSLTDWDSISTGWYFSAAIKTDGTLWTWGDNNYGRLGQNDTTDRSSPVQVGSLTDWSKVACGDNHILSVKTDGTYGHGEEVIMVNWVMMIRHTEVLPCKLDL